MATDDSGALVVLGEIVHVQREYLRDGDPQRMWDELLDALLRTTGSAHGFIAEVDWSMDGMPGLTIRAMVWLGLGDEPVAPHPDIGLLLAQVIADQAPVVLDLGSGQAPDSSRFAPVSGFLGLPLMSSGRLVGIVGLTSPEVPYDRRWIGVLQPLLATCASIVEAIQSTRDRDAAIAELEQTAACLQALVNGTTHAVAVVDAAGILRSANPAAGRLTGIPVADLVGRSLLDLISTPDRDRARRAVRRFVRRGVPPGMPPVVLGVVGPEGTTIPVEASIGEMSLDGQRRLVILGHDISDRLTAQFAFARAGEILDATPDVIAWAGPEGHLRYLNKGGRTMLGLARDDPVDHIGLDELTAPEWRDRFVDDVLPPGGGCR